MPCNVSVRGAFQLTPSVGRATSRGASGTGGYIISIHALREEGDSSISAMAMGAGVFQSTPSARRATLAASPDFQPGTISIHALREEGDWDAAGR